MFYIMISFSGSPYFPRIGISSKTGKVKLSIELKEHFVSICVSRLMFFMPMHMLTMGQSIIGELSKAFFKFSVVSSVKRIQEKSNSFHWRKLF